MEQTIGTKVDVSEEIMKMIEEHGLTEEPLTFEVEESHDEHANDDADESQALFVMSNKGTTILQFNNYRYRKAYNSKNGTRWNCSTNKDCTAFVYLNDDDEIILTNQNHGHSPPRVEFVDNEQNDTAVLITSRKGKEMLLFRQYTYRRQYDKCGRTRWVCSTLKNCRAVVFTDSKYYITSTLEEHCHAPPKYYLKPDNVLQALREPLILETD